MLLVSFVSLFTSDSSFLSGQWACMIFFLLVSSLIGMNFFARSMLFGVAIGSARMFFYIAICWMWFVSVLFVLAPNLQVDVGAGVGCGGGVGGGVGGRGAAVYGTACSTALNAARVSVSTQAWKSRFHSGMVDGKKEWKYWMELVVKCQNFLLWLLLVLECPFQKISSPGTATCP